MEKSNEFNTDVLIVGAGPTGLMMANQLARFGISFRIIDQQANYAIESRAIGVQARSVEVFQNLGLADEFLQHAQVGREAHFYLNGKPKLTLNFNDAHLDDTPFPFLFFISQSQTEQILLRHLEQQNIWVERLTHLVTFSQTDNDVIAEINREKDGNEIIRCRYIVGCDGAHSTVRHILKIPFEGASYEQQFVLADAQIAWSYPFYPGLMAFFDAKGILLHVNLGNLHRVISARFSGAPKNVKPLTREEVEHLAKDLTHANDLHLSDVVWMTRFTLHHRAVKQYSKGRAFLAGDAAHIHSPVAAQGMNTGLQDASNLAWKIASVIKFGAPPKLLDTYQLERQHVSATLLKTTDRAFGLMVSNNFLVKLLRRLLIPLMMFFLGKFVTMRKGLIRFMSQLDIRYHKNDFIAQDIQQADTKFLAGPAAGCRAPDAPIYNTTLFGLFQSGFSHALIFQSEEVIDFQKILALGKKYAGRVHFHTLSKSFDTAVAFHRYGISSAGIYFIRPDGYIGFRSFGKYMDSVEKFLEQMFQTTLH